MRVSQAVRSSAVLVTLAMPLATSTAYLAGRVVTRSAWPRGLAALADESWIGGCVRCRTHLVDCCEAAGFSPTIRHTTDDYVVVQNLVARGLGVTVLPASALAAYRHPDVRVVPMPLLGRRHVGLAFRAGADAVPANAALAVEVGRAAAAAGVVLTELRAADGGGLEDLFLTLTRAGAATPDLAPPGGHTGDPTSDALEVSR